MRNPPMLDVDTEKVCYLIVKSREFDAKVEIDDPQSGSNAGDDGMRAILEDFADDPTYAEIIEFINSLDEEEQVRLVALAWLGRGTYDIEDWGEAVAQARDAHNERTAEYLIGLPLLGDYLEEGLAAFGASCDEVARIHL